jgi:hypothetical protein
MPATHYFVKGAIYVGAERLTTPKRQSIVHVSIDVVANVLGSRAIFWQSLLHILGIVTAFTVGHSLTLTLAAMNFVHVPSRPVEVLIAVSILVSTVHALQPMFPGKEAWIAALFGLIHGLAFASTLERLSLSRWDRVAGVLSFNLGIETMQLLVVALVLPSLLMLSHTHAYSPFRIVGGALACIVAAMWVAERLFRIVAY